MTEEQPIKFIRQNRRSMMMRAVPGVIEVFIPTHYQESDKCVVNFVKKNLPKIQAYSLPEPEHKITQQDILDLVKHWSEQMQLHPSRVSLRDMRRKWGSCSSIGSVTLNTRLCWLDHSIAEYIVVHELAHLKELNHSKAFWTIVGQYLPDYKTRIHTLRAEEKRFWGQKS
jgi:predicted metal-dependent hydrolase